MDAHHGNRHRGCLARRLTNRAAKAGWRPGRRHRGVAAAGIRAGGGALRVAIVSGGECLQRRESASSAVSDGRLAGNYGRGEAVAGMGQN